MTNPQEHKQRVTHWRNKQKALLAEAEKVQKIIEDLQAVCRHEWAHGISAISEDAHASPYAQPQCQICGKYF